MLDEQVLLSLPDDPEEAFLAFEDAVNEKHFHDRDSYYRSDLEKERDNINDMLPNALGSGSFSIHMG